MKPRLIKNPPKGWALLDKLAAGVRVRWVPDSVSGMYHSRSDRRRLFIGDERVAGGHEFDCCDSLTALVNKKLVVEKAGVDGVLEYVVTDFGREQAAVPRDPRAVNP